MGNRTERLLAIKNIISKLKVSSQDELLNILEEKGLNYTQATLSRDLKFLKVNKIADPEKGYIYELPEHHNPASATSEYAESYAAQGFVSIQFSNNLGIIKTLPGYASSIASLIDRSNPFEIVGTIAGDDTILIIPHENVNDRDVIYALVLIIPELRDKI
jgi:transcriptional regulator of arginine metabolism